MLSLLVSWSLRHRLVVILIWFGVALAGIWSFLRLPLDAFPDTTPVQVQINTVAPALSPLEVERQLTAQVEQVIGGLPGLVEVRSLSKFGLSQVTVLFDDRTGIYLARQVILERLQGVELPPGVERPKLGPVATGLGEVFHYLVRGDRRTLAELRAEQDWSIKRQLRTVPGVAEVNSWGGDERQIQVVVDPVRLQKYGLSLSSFARALEENNGNVGGGTIDRAGESSLVQGVGLVTHPHDIEEMVVASHEGIPVRVSDVASVVEGREIRRGVVTADGRGEAVLGLGFLLMGENSHQVTRGLKLRLDEVKKSLPAGVQVDVVYDRTELVERVLRTVKTNLLEGALLVIAVLFVFLGNVRAGLLVAATIPLSMLFAFNVMLQVGITGSLMSLGALDFGLIVDSSLILVENASRRLGEAGDRPVVDVVEEATLEVREPTMFGELILLIVYLPLLLLEGVEGKLFRPMAWTVVFALLGSMLLSLTLMPVLASLVLRRGAHEGEPSLVTWLKRGYQPLLRGALRRGWLVLVPVVVLLGVSVVAATRMGAEFIPRLHEGAVVINTIRLAGVSVDESARYGTQLERLLLQAFPDEIDHAWTRTGTAEVATDPMGVELSDVFVTLKPSEQWKRAATQAALVEQMQQELSAMPGMRMVFTQPIEMRVNEMVAGIRSDVGFKLFGDDLEVLRDKARLIEVVLKKIDGARDVVVEQVTGQPMLRIEVDRAALGRHGIPAREVLDVVEAIGTHPVGLLQEGERRFPITVRLDERYRVDSQTVGSVLVTASNGMRVPLASVTRIAQIEGPSTIQREWGKRRLVVQVNVRGRDVDSFLKEATAAIDREVPLPAGYYLRTGGQHEQYERARRRLQIVVPVALGLILALLYFTYGRVVDALRVFTGVPLAMIGGVLALWARGMPFSISAGVGFVALAGVAVLGDMVLVSTIRANLASGAPLLEAIEQAASQRLRPVLMTALVASLGFVPMAVSHGIGAEVQRPLATVVIGGILSSTLLTLVVLPVIFARVAGCTGPIRPEDALAGESQP